MSVEQIVSCLQKQGIHLPKPVIERAKDYFSQPKQGVSGIDYSAASVYAAMKTSECIPISIERFMEKIGHYNKKAFIRTYRKIMWNAKARTAKCTIKPSIFVADYCGRLGIPKRARGFAMRLAKNIENDVGFSGRNPIVLAASIIYITSIVIGNRLTQQIIANLFRIREATLRNNYQMIERHKKAYIESFWKKYNKREIEEWGHLIDFDYPFDYNR